MCLMISSLSTTKVKALDNSKTLVDNFDTEAPPAWIQHENLFLLIVLQIFFLLGVQQRRPLKIMVQ